MILSIHGFCSGRTIFPCSHRVQDPIPTPMWCGHRSNYQIISIFVFYCLLFQFNLLLRDSIPLSQNVLSFFFFNFNFRIFIHAENNFNHIKEGFLDHQGETTPVCLPIKPPDALVLLLALTNLFVHNSIFVLISRKGQPNLSSCKVLFLFHNCYYCYC